MWFSRRLKIIAFQWKYLLQAKLLEENLIFEYEQMQTVYFSESHLE